MLRPSYVEFVWTAVKWSFVTLGGFAGVTKIIEWLLSGPKIIGQMETFFAEGFSDDAVGSNPRTEVLVLLYVVNKRVQPTTIRAFKAKLKITGKWIEGVAVTIPDEFTMLGLRFDFESSRLYESTGSKLLEYGRGVRGYLRFRFVGLEVEKIKNAHMHVEIEDAFGKKHTVKFALEPAKPGADAREQYFPGTGMAK